jgi:polysaccharide export outer membrane protein
MKSGRILYLSIVMSYILAPQLDGQTTKTSVSNGAAAASATLRVEASAKEYLIGPDDILSINVWKEPEISRTLPVRPDGNISLPLIGDLMASGETPVQLQSNIRGQLLAFLSDPEVTVVVQEAKSHKFNIVGEVEKPGAYLLSTPMSVLDAIALAGGLRDFARSGKIYVLRINPDGTRARLPFNYKQVIKGENLKPDVWLQPHDTIVVP